MKGRILFVDDDPNVLNGLKRLFRPMRKEWEMEFAQSGEKALDIFSSRIFDVVVTDIQMPGMDGVELLTKIREIHPETLRIVLSGQASHNLILKSVKVSHQFLSKPCDTENLKHTINCAISLSRLVSGMERIPSLPSIYEEIVKALESDDVSIQLVGSIISKDVGMSAKILHLVNSAFFGLRSKVANPADATAILGLDTIKSLVLSIQVFSQFENNTEIPKSFINGIQDHCMITGVLAKKITLLQTGKKDMGEYAFTAGLLHDLGKLILLSNFPDKYAKAIQLQKENDEITSLYNSEQRVFNTTHAEVGGYVLGLWGLPSSVVEAIQAHHTPAASLDKNFSPISAVHIANAIVNMKSLESAKPDEFDLEYVTNMKLVDKIQEWRSILNNI